MYLDIASILIANGADVDIALLQISGLYPHSESEKVNIIKLLLEKGANIEARDEVSLLGHLAEL